MKWLKCKLGDVIAVKKGDYITKKEAKEGPYPVILGGTEPAYYIDRFNHTGKAIVVSRSGASAGFVSFWNEPIFITDGFLIEPLQGINYEFLFYLMKCHQGELQGLQGGSAIPHVTPKIINGIDVLLPSIEEQERIADILSAYDDLIENNQTQIKLLEEAAQRLYKEWFVDLRFPGHETTPIINGTPEGWTHRAFKDLVEVKYGKDHKNINDGAISVYGSGGLMRKCAKSLYKGESVLIPRKGSLNNIMYVDEEFWTVDTMFYTKMKMEHVGLFAYYFVKSFDMYSMNIGAAVPSTTTSTLEALDVVLPTKGILEKFDQYAKGYSNQVNTLHKQIDVATEIRNRLIPKLMCR